MTADSPDLWFVFDVESVGLYGEGFAVGWVVIREDTGAQVDEGCLWCPPEHVVGTINDLAWVEENVLPHLRADARVPTPTHVGPMTLRASFWAEWEKWKAKGARAAADVPVPVEAAFLAACVGDEPKGRTWEAPYPLYDVASFMEAAGLNPLDNHPRFAHELPAHHPLHDARQSARLLFETLRGLRSPSTAGESDDDDDDWKREQAMEAGMAFGADAYNEHMGWSTEPPEGEP